MIEKPLVLITPLSLVDDISPETLIVCQPTGTVDITNGTIKPDCKKGKTVE